MAGRTSAPTRVLRNYTAAARRSRCCSRAAPGATSTTFRGARKSWLRAAGPESATTQLERRQPTRSLQPTWQGGKDGRDVVRQHIRNRPDNETAAISRPQIKPGVQHGGIEVAIDQSFEAARRTAERHHAVVQPSHHPRPRQQLVQQQGEAGVGVVDRDECTTRSELSSSPSGGSIPTADNTARAGVSYRTAAMLCESKPCTCRAASESRCWPYQGPRSSHRRPRQGPPAQRSGS
jgi:hypothetical protein